MKGLREFENLFIWFHMFWFGVLECVFWIYVCCEGTRLVRMGISSKTKLSFFINAYVFNIPVAIMISVELSLVNASCGLWEWKKNGAQMEGWYVYFVWDWCCNYSLFYVTSIIGGLWSKMIMWIWVWSLVW